MKIVVEFDSETLVATVAVGGGTVEEIRDASFTIEKGIESIPNCDTGFMGAEDTGKRTITISGQLHK